MTSATAELARTREIRLGFLPACERAFLWLATWTERNVPAGKDGLKLPDNVRRIIDTRNFYV